MPLPTKPLRPKQRSPRTSSLLLSDVTNNIQKPASLILLAGPPGVGKTSLACQWPGKKLVVHDNQDNGVIDLKSRQLVGNDVYVVPSPVDSFKDLKDYLQEVEEADHDFKVLILEGLTGFEQLAKNACCRADFNNDWSASGFASFGSGLAATASKYWSPLLSTLQRIRVKRNIHVILTAHTQLDQVETPDTPRYQVENVAADKRIWALTHRAFEAVLMMTPLVVADQEKGDKFRKATEVTTVIVTTNTGARAAKNRWGLRSNVECGKTPKESYLALARAAKFDPNTGF